MGSMLSMEEAMVSGLTFLRYIPWNLIVNLRCWTKWSW